MQRKIDTAETPGKRTRVVELPPSALGARPSSTAPPALQSSRAPHVPLPPTRATTLALFGRPVA